MDGIAITAVAFTALNPLVLVPIILYYLRRFHRFYGQSESLQNRSRLVVYTQNTLLIAALLIERTYALFVDVMSPIAIPMFAPQWTANLLFNLFWSFILILFSCKAFNLYFEQQFNLAVSDLSWRRSINPQDMNWFIAKRQTFGNPIFLFRLCLIPYAVIVLTQSICFAVTGQGLLTDILRVIFTLILVIIALYIAWRVRKIEDIYSIKNELLYQSLSVMLCVVIYILGIFTFHTMCGSTDRCHRMEWILDNAVLQLLALSIALFNTAYPLHVSRERILKRSASGSQSGRLTARGVDAICQIISQYSSFKAFMQYLVENQSLISFH